MHSSHQDSIYRLFEGETLPISEISSLALGSEQRVTQASELLKAYCLRHADKVVITTSGGKAAPFMISLLGEAIHLASPKDAAVLASIPVVFIDQQDTPDETIDLLVKLKILYPEVNLKRYTFDISVDTFQAEVRELSVKAGKNIIDPLQAFNKITKVGVLPDILDDLGGRDRIISGNRADQSDYRAKLKRESQQLVGEKVLWKYFPSLNVQGEDVKRYITENNLPQHGLTERSSIGSWLEMTLNDDQNKPQEQSGAFDDRSSRAFSSKKGADEHLEETTPPCECGLHLDHKKLDKVPVREVTDWSERLSIRESLTESGQSFYKWLLHKIKTFEDSGFKDGEGI